jgi:16S rRNA (guanine966-N2)-methyltransferase
VRIIAGTARGRRLQAPEGQSTRPIIDRAKEGIFNMLVSRMELVDATVLDLYAGSGSFGLECLSRGARKVTFVEMSRSASAVIAANLATLGFTERASIVTSPVLAALSGRLGADEVDLAFCDPPYVDDPWSELLPLIHSHVLVGHASTDVVLTAQWQEVKRRNYGRAHVVVARRLDGGADTGMLGAVNGVELQ